MNVPADPSVKVVWLAEVMAGAASTVRVKVWVAGEPTPLVAVKVIGNEPDWVGVPARTPVPGVKVTPVGRVPDSARVGVGEPVAVTVNVPAEPSVKVVWLAEVMAGAVPEVFTVRVKAWVAGEPTPLVAVKVIGNEPDWVGVPARTPVPGVKVTPVGRVPDSARVGVGEPVAVTVNVPAEPSVKVVWLAEVMAGAVPEVFTVRVKAWVAGEPTPLVAVKVIGNEPDWVGVPARTPVPGVKVTPVGRVPDSARVGVGEPVAVTVNVPAEPSVKVVWLAEVMAGAVPEVFTVRVKAWVAGEPTPLVAVKVIGNEPDWVGVPARTPVPGVKVTPVGRVPDSARVGVGEPVAVTVNVPAEPSVKVVWLAEVMAGAVPVPLTVRVKAWVAGVPTPLSAVMVIGKEPDWVGVPARTPVLDVPENVVLRVTPVGNVPDSVKVGGP